VTALTLSREGSIAATAASLGAAASSDSSIDASDPRDPALLALLVGHQAGELLPRALGAYACGVTATVAAALLACASGAGLALTGFVLMLLVRGFGWVGSIAGVFAARATDEEHPARAVFRGQTCASLVTIFGLGASLFWLERPQLFALMAAGIAGLLGVTLPALLGSLPLGRSSATARELSDGKSGAAVTLARGAALGLSSLGPALVWPALALALALTTLSSRVAAGLIFGAFAAGAVALSPLALALSGFGILTPHARALASLARLELEPPRRPSRLDDASTTANVAGFTQAALAVFVSLGLGLMALGAAGTFTAGALACATALGLLGVTLLLLLAARTTRTAALGAKLVSSEVDRQLPRSAGHTPAAEAAPSYRACVDAALTAARSASPLELGALLAVPFAVGAVLRSGTVGLSAALLGLGAAASLGGLLAALGGRATRAALHELRRRLRGNEAGLTPSAAIQAAAFGDLVGVTAASSIEAFALVLALTVLSLLPLLP
jgi:K(+)-stimulated pyrophosphate-energized sodium pump